MALGGDPGGRYLRRPRLEQAMSRSRLTLTEAGAGYGKSVLARQYSDVLGAATMYVPARTTRAARPAPAAGGRP
ncbi:MAG TPA: hypothetical protein VGH27_23020 [Streptosporangiaceae bacterium]|jgi:hypothetical protein